ncbi:hypothetical protein BTJ39_20805 [Izhakiella australiensis]|uniref:Uncharacterized protein n=1 Tax=Izhakiella australiensis TaxID=1926881 RepID=A0A1S8YDZ1_9GAMM|nr:hypothetical protein BTJ39_20805 [Izhakiella australiensis]
MKKFTGEEKVWLISAGSRSGMAVRQATRSACAGAESSRAFCDRSAGLAAIKVCRPLAGHTDVLVLVRKAGGPSVTGVPGLQQ